LLQRGEGTADYFLGNIYGPLEGFSLCHHGCDALGEDAPYRAATERR